MSFIKFHLSSYNKDLGALLKLLKGIYVSMKERKKEIITRTSFHKKKGRINSYYGFFG